MNLLHLYLWGVAGLFISVSVRMTWHLRWARRLPSLDRAEDTVPVATTLAPRVSVVLAARDEAGRIEQTVRRLLAQRAEVKEVIVVDDRSNDDTGQILRRVASDEPRLKVIRVDVLPPEWLGKCHACHQGAEAATGDWILFTDADCWLAPDALARALRVAERERVDHVALTPGVTPQTKPAAAWHIAFLLTLADWLSRVNRDRPKAFIGMGAFNLVRAAAYRTCGGYQALRLTVLDDVRLGLLLRRAGFRTRGFIGGADTECHWGRTVRDMVRLMEKNYFAALDYRVSAVVGLVLVCTGLWGGALMGPFTGTWAGLAACVSLMSLSIPAAVVTRRLGWSLDTALWTPWVFPVLFYAITNSAVITLRRGGIRWRETFYSLPMLRRGNVRP